ncbi:hypothetical protein [Furfurilactobacillus entadae]|uniref:hypothetical protein n=1 Tax=Furfurilactobacillus entadae TaxID=2922307 RepID=UPI0035E4C2C8
MQRSNELDIEKRNEYVKFLVEVLVRKYHISMSGIAQDADISVSGLSALLSDSRTLRGATIDQLEDLLIDLYQPLLDFEIQMHQAFVDELFK